MDEAVEWVKRCPNPTPGALEVEIEIRQVFEMEDFAELTPEMRSQAERQRDQLKNPSGH